MNFTKVLLVLGLVGLVGCGAPVDSGDDDDDNNNPQPTPTGSSDLQSGTYISSNGQVMRDECGWGVTPNDLNNVQVTVQVDANQVVIQAGSSNMQFQRSGSSFSLSDSGQETQDQCTYGWSDAFTGTATSSTSFSLQEQFNAQAASGDCTGFPLPCATELAWQFNKQ